MTRELVRRIIAKRAATPGAANSVLQKLKVLVHFAIDNGWLKDEPTARMKKFAGGEFHTWTEDEIATFERCWTIGTMARLAFALLLYTGQRRSDVVRMSWTDVQDGMIGVVPQKTRRTTGGTKLWIPIHSELAKVLAESEKDRGTILRTAYGEPFAGNGFGNFMANKIDQAKRPAHCVMHGLRKAAARRLAEAGCSANEIAAITGHATLTEVSRYTKAAEQKSLARAPMNRLARKAESSFSQTSSAGLGMPEKTLVNQSVRKGAWWSRGESNP